MNEFVKEFVNKKFGNNTIINTELISNEFSEMISELSDDDFCNLLIISGYIPDLYIHDSSEETLYTKLCEIIEVDWARRMGFKSYYVTQKSSYEDVVIYIDNSVIVSDTKTFRLGRSQTAPNVKDFVKPEDYRKWINRHPNSKLGGLIIFPQLHEWSKGSDAHYYCSDKDNPIVMLPFHYLAYLLDSKMKLNYNTNKLALLWDYKTIFPNKVKDRIEYWKKLNKQILDINGDTVKNFKDYLLMCESLFFKHIKKEIEQLSANRSEVIKSINKDIDELDENKLREEYKNYKIEQETYQYDTIIDRILKLRINKDLTETRYKPFIDEYFESV